MIPKIIHYTWFSGEPFPEKIQKCIDSWHTQLPDYKFVCWDAEKLKEIESTWVSEALSEKKWAFAADYVRLYAVYHYGGIYLDTDCFLYKPFDEFLSENCFIGKEHSVHIEGRKTEMYLTSHCFGAVVNNPFIGRCLSYYNDRHFKLSNDESLPMDLKFSTLLLPYIQSEIAKQFGYDPRPSMRSLQRLEGICIYPDCYFDALTETSSSYCKHLALGGWRSSRVKDSSITFLYKISWRIEYIFTYIADRCGYILIKKQ